MTGPLFTPNTAKAYRKGFAAGRTTRKQRECGGIDPKYGNPYSRTDCRRVWDESFADGNGSGRFNLDQLD